MDLVDRGVPSDSEVLETAKDSPSWESRWTGSKIAFAIDRLDRPSFDSPAGMPSLELARFQNCQFQARD